MCAIPELFVHLFNMSITQNVIPDDWKVGLVTLLPMKGDSSNPADIRPITITHICGKILESIINEGNNNYFEQNNLFSRFEMRFRKNKSTTAAIAEIVTDINIAQNFGQFTVACFIDYCKVFNSVKPSVLFDKLSAYGIIPDTIGWFKNYFLNRTQSTRTSVSLSKLKEIFYGVP